MMGLPALLQRPIIIFWARKTFSAGISIPRSPRATIMPSLASMISSNLAAREEVHYPCCSEGRLPALSSPFRKGALQCYGHSALPGAILLPCNTAVRGKKNKTIGGRQFTRLCKTRSRGAQVDHSPAHTLVVLNLADDLDVLSLFP